MSCLNPKPVKFEVYNKIDEKTGEIYRTKRPIFLKLEEEITPETDFIPCGKCAGCLVDKANDWATRCALEAQNWPVNCFITLTYDAKHLPPKRSLQKADLQKFWKRLRKALGNQKIKYLACGEYGPTTQRPHYHAAIFNYWPNDAAFFKNNHQGDKLYTSQTLQKIWGNGYIILGLLNFETAAYVARYVYKKAYGQEIAKPKNKEPEFIIASKRPAIAANWTTGEKWTKLLRSNSVILGTRNGLKIKKIPQFLKNKFKTNNHEEYFNWAETIKKSQKKNVKESLHLTDLNIGNWLKNKATIKQQQLKRLDKRTDL